MVPKAEAERFEAAYLSTPEAIRERAEQLYALARAGSLEYFALDEGELPKLARRVLDVTRATYPNVRDIPYHARWRHFSAGGIDRLAELDAALAPLDPDERLCAKFELAITSVLLDAGAGSAWSYREGQSAYARSEGLAVASFRLFAAGAFSADPVRRPLRADADMLRRLDVAELGDALQVGPDNPLVGLEGRTMVLRKLGEVVGQSSRYFGTAEPRLGRLGLYLVSQAQRGALPARAVLEAVLDALGEIWPGREVCAGKNLGDVWRHPAVGRVPFHKLSQWLSYSLCEPLEERGVAVTGLGELTGLAEYRNGGLFLDGGVLVPKRPEVYGEVHSVDSPVVVEWRGLTIALLDRTALELRRMLGLDAGELPLAKVLEGGTWRAGRELAQARRADAASPIRVASDGTVF
jgi:hypothetical protein